MVYFSGFSLKNESSFFDPYLKKSAFNVAGFSYGAIKACKYTLTCKSRIDTLQLYSPAFFQTKPDRFKRLQLIGYDKDKEQYLQNFMQSCFAPYAMRECEHVETTESELSELLYYEYLPEMLEQIIERGIVIEVFLGQEDQIIDSVGAKEFFLPFATTYLIKDANHFLQIE